MIMLQDEDASGLRSKNSRIWAFPLPLLVMGPPIHDEGLSISSPPSLGSYNQVAVKCVFWTGYRHICLEFSFIKRTKSFKLWHTSGYEPWRRRLSCTQYSLKTLILFSKIYECNGQRKCEFVKSNYIKKQASVAPLHSSDFDSHHVLHCVWTCADYSHVVIFYRIHLILLDQGLYMFHEACI